MGENMNKNIYIVYELKNREYDSVLLLKSELEGRGYRVEIINKQMMFRWKYKKAVVVIPNCYTTANYDYYRYLLNSKHNYIINLQLEQVISKKSEENGYFNPKGKAAEVVHLCWGENSYNRLLTNNIDKHNLYITGATQLDFLRPEFKELWYSRDEIIKKYSLPKGKIWILYISSFAYVNNELVVKHLQKDLGGESKAQYIKQFEQISIESQKITLELLEKLVKNNKDIAVIYRNHPAEKTNKRITKLAEKYNNSFFNISELNIKQWLMVSDQVVTWFSTSIVECYMAKKMCYVVRPIPIPKDIDATIYNNCNSFINNYDELEFVIRGSKRNDYDTRFPIDIEDINSYYEVDSIPAYIKVANVIETYSNKEIRKSSYLYNLRRNIYILKHGIILKYYIKRIYSSLYERFGVRIKNSNLRNRFAFENLEIEIRNKEYYLKDENYKLDIIGKVLKLINLKLVK